MRMSCNGCRILRKACTRDCALRPCLDWINSPDSQAHATLFLAKFYGRAGLLNLITSGPAHLYPEIFRSLLYEACGRIINPVYGSVGLMCSGEWERCHAAVQAVLHGGRLNMQVPDGDDDDSIEQPGNYPIMPFHGSDIRHLTPTSSFRRVRSRRSFKGRVDSSAAELETESEAKFTITGWENNEEAKRAPSHDSVETVEQALVEQLTRRVEPEAQLGELGLELTLGLKRSGSAVIEISDSEV